MGNIEVHHMHSDLILQTMTLQEGYAVRLGWQQPATNGRDGGRFDKLKEAHHGGMRW